MLPKVDKRWYFIIWNKGSFNFIHLIFENTRCFANGYITYIIVFTTKLDHLNNEEAFSYFSCNKNKNISSIVREFIAHYQLDDIQYDQIRMRFSKLSIERRSFVRNRNIDKWNESMFSHSQTYQRWPRMMLKWNPFLVRLLLYSRKISTVSPISTLITWQQGTEISPPIQQTEISFGWPRSWVEQEVQITNYGPLPWSKSMT